MDHSELTAALSTERQLRGLERIAAELDNERMNMDAKFTPGPWEFHRGKDNAPDDASVLDGCAFATIMTLSEDHIARVWGDIGAAEGNARLISAAPDLLAEMKRYLPILEALEQQPDGWEFCSKGTGIGTVNSYRAAIAKATK